MNLIALEYPRHVHGPDGASRIVSGPEKCAEALTQGWSLVPVLTTSQAAAVFAAQMAAGEVAAPVTVPEPIVGAEPEPVPVVEQRKRGRPRKV